MKISLIFGENSTKCMQNIAKNARYWRYLSILNLLLRIPKTPKGPLWVRFPPGVPKYLVLRNEVFLSKPIGLVYPHA